MRTFTAVEIPEALRGRIGARMAPLLEGQFLQGQGGVRAVAAEHLHVTVRFLGDIDEAKLPGLLEDLGTAVAPVPAASIRLAYPGTFPSRGKGRARVLWIGVDEPAGTLTEIERRISPLLTTHGVPPEKRAYRPHVTLARARDGRGANVLRAALEELHGNVSDGQDGADLDGADLDSTDLDSTDLEGPGSDSAAQDGAAQDSAAQDSAAQDSAAQDGTAHDGAFTVEHLTVFGSELTPEGPRYTVLARLPLAGLPLAGAPGTAIPGTAIPDTTIPDAATQDAASIDPPNSQP